MNSNNSKRVSKYVNLPNGLKIHYQESGNGDTPILFVPGWTMTLDVFCRQFEFFANSTEFRFISFDPRSHGGSTMTYEGNHYEQHGRDLHEFIDALQLENVVLCGWSFATLATLAYVNQFGHNKLCGFIMLDGPPKAAGANQKEEWVTYTYDDADGFAERCTMGKLRDSESANMEFANWLLQKKDPNAIEWLIGITKQTPNEVAALLNATALFLNYQDDLKAISCLLPVWCVLREERREEVFAWCESNLPNASLSAFGGHMMFWEEAEQFCNELLQFVSGLEFTK